jgi:hypothetical protein
LGTIIATPIRSAATTHAIAMTGWPATTHPTTPPPASAIMNTSTGPRPPSPRRIESMKMTLVKTAWAAAMTTLQDAPSARCDKHATIASTLQMSQVPRCGRVVPRTVSRTYGTVSAMLATPASTPRTGAV